MFELRPNVRRISFCSIKIPLAKDQFHVYLPSVLYFETLCNTSIERMLPVGPEDARRIDPRCSSHIAQRNSSAGTANLPNIQLT